MGNNDKRPKIRFKGFNDDWEQYKLGEISNKVTTKNSSLKYLETFTNSAEYGIISQKDFFENNISKVEKLDRYYVVEPEDFVYNPRISINAPVGPINRNTLDRCGVMSPLYSVFKTHNIDNTYLEYFFKSNYWHSFMFFNGDSGARSDRFSIKDTVFMEMPIPYPNIYEQSKIGVFLKQLDNDITLHQRKLEKLGNIKKSMLEKMFPKDENKVPEIRFKGFNDDWEQHKLEEIAEFNPKSELPYKFEYVDLESVIGTEMISHRTENKETAPSRAKRLAQYGDIFYQTVRPYQKNNYLFNKLNGDYVFSTGYAQIRAYIDNKFLINILQTNNFVKKVLDNCTGTSYPAINSNELSKLEVKLPSYKNEQNKIGEFFKQLDKDITLHQRKLEKLKNIKKACLEKMFV